MSWSGEFTTEALRGDDGELEQPNPNDSLLYMNGAFTEELKEQDDEEEKDEEVDVEDLVETAETVEASGSGGVGE